MTADIFTKNLPRATFEKHVRGICGDDAYYKYDDTGFVRGESVKVIWETGLTSSDVSGTQRGELCAVATAIVDSEVGVEAVRARSDTGVVPRSDGGPGSIVGTYSGANMGASKPMKCGPG